MYVNAKNATNAFKLCKAEKIDANTDRISLELVEERIRANLEQILTLVQLINQLTQDISVKTTPRRVLSLITLRQDPR